MFSMCQSCFDGDVAVGRAILDAEEGRLGIDSTPGKHRAVAAAAAVATAAGAALEPAPSAVKNVRGGSRKRARAPDTKSEEQGAPEVPTSDASGAAGGSSATRTVRKVTTLTKFVTKSVQKYSNGIDMEIDLASERCVITNRTGRALNMDAWVLESDIGTQVRGFPVSLALPKLHFIVRFFLPCRFAVHLNDAPLLIRGSPHPHPYTPTHPHPHTSTTPTTVFPLPRLPSGSCFPQGTLWAPARPSPCGLARTLTCMLHRRTT